MEQTAQFEECGGNLG
jgi:hypothetical protein